jgi:rhodanese-related sulfurtransferase
MKHSTISPQALKNELDANQILLIDVREPDEWQEIHIKGATLVPLASLASEIDKVCQDRNQTVYLYCARGRRSHQAALIMLSLGYHHIIELEGGMFNWVDAGLPCQTGSESR